MFELCQFGRFLFAEWYV